MTRGTLEKLHAAYQQRHGESWDTRLCADIAAMMAHGYLLHTPRACLMGFRTKADSVRYSLARGDAIEPGRHAETYGDCWFVWFALGDLQTILGMIPEPLPLVAFARRDSVRVWSLERLKRIALLGNARGVKNHGF